MFDKLKDKSNEKGTGREKLRKYYLTKQGYASNLVRFATSIFPWFVSTHRQRQPTY
jgi:hypothetical protein